MKSITLFKIALFSLLLATLIPAHAQNYTKITYVHSDADGTPFAATDSQGNVEWQIDHYPYGKEYSNTQVARKNDISFAGKPYDEEIGLSYFGGRWYDPDIGRFTGIDPMPVNPNDYRTFNRYSYGFNNPYKYVDPDGNLPFLIPVAIFIAKEIAAEAASRATGGATDFLSVRRMGTKAIKKGAGLFVKKKPNNLGSGGQNDIIRVRHITDKTGRNGIKKDGAINPSRGNPIGVHVEVAPFGNLKDAAKELGTARKNSKNVVEFDMPKSALKPTYVGPRNTAVIPTKKPLNITNKKPKFK